MTERLKKNTNNFIYELLSILWFKNPPRRWRSIIFKLLQIPPPPTPPPHDKMFSIIFSPIILIGNLRVTTLRLKSFSMYALWMHVRVFREV